MKQKHGANAPAGQIFLLGIDAGGTNTDAVLLVQDEDVSEGPSTSFSERTPTAPAALPSVRLLAAAKTRTKHDDLPASVREVLHALARALDDDAAARALGGASLLGRVSRVTLGATLAVNALVQDKADAVALALSAGPGLDPRRFAMGRHVFVVPGGLDHRGTEVSPLDVGGLEVQAARWRAEGIAAVACVGKFSPRNPAHEQHMARALSRGSAASATNSPTAGPSVASTAAPAEGPAIAPDVKPGASFCITLGHKLSGRLNFPRRIATAYFNAAVQRLHSNFLDAVESALAESGVRAAVRLLKADGGAVPLSLSRREPVQSVLSGPAASVMGVLALCPAARQGCALLLDIGGTTTDMALAVDGSPVVDREGMTLQGRRTLVRALASVSIGVGGDSLVSVDGHGAGASVRVGPLRQGPAMAFGGTSPTLLDALNTLHSIPQAHEAGTGSSMGEAQARYAVHEPSYVLAPNMLEDMAGELAGNVAASLCGMEALAQQCGLDPRVLARKAVDNALNQIRRAADALTEAVNARPIYTLAGLRALQEARPARAWLVGGPAACMKAHLTAALGLPVDCPPHTAVANAVGAALTLPTDAVEVYADTGSGLLRAPALDLTENIRKGCSLDALGERARELLLQRLEQAGAEGAAVEITEAESFATLDDNGFGSRDMRVVCQAVPGLAGLVAD
ncbi:MAG: hydantoinase/oxoprolinase family protein [Desulfovibrio sp.]|uniref:hydantoinase/oxoprolinase family protein n=1 Tax=Desulfovibrio sp. TaxID=885 RepID=UPI002A360FDA|nr:hydantoinase/oxoprolinase family protein [Desulfovibrio sp.]MDY0260389.1 hydantoinase/oxoprolinase family protein [Desulfovibrio sp.]